MNAEQQKALDTLVAKLQSEGLTVTVWPLNNKGVLVSIDGPEKRVK